MGEVVEAGGDVRMAGRQRGAEDIQRLAVKRLGFGVEAGGLEQVGEVVEAGGDVGMSGRQRGTADLQRLALKRPGLAMSCEEL